MVESQPSKLLVAGSIPVSRSIRLRARVSARFGATGRQSAEGATASRLRHTFAALTASSGQAGDGAARRCAQVRKRACLAEAARGAGVLRRRADVAQLAERVLGKDEVTGSIPVVGSRLILEI